METRHEAIAMALRMRANYIETGDVTLSKRDVADRLGSGSDWGGNRGKWQGMLVRAAQLTVDQLQLVENLRRYACEEETA